MNKKSISIVLIFMIIWIVLSILGILWENRFDWPDNVHIDYGFPFVWSTNTLSTIVGAVNLWSINTTALIMNLAFWMLINLIVIIILLFILDRKYQS